MTDGLNTKRTQTPKVWRMFFDFKVFRWQVGLNVILGTVSLFVFISALVRPERWAWITWVDALQIFLLFQILATATHLHYKLIEPKKD